MRLLSLGGHTLTFALGIHRKRPVRRRADHRWLYILLFLTKLELDRHYAGEAEAVGPVRAVHTIRGLRLFRTE